MAHGNTLLQVLLSTFLLEITSAALPTTIAPGVQLGYCPSDAQDLPSDVLDILREKVVPAMRCPELGFCDANPAESCQQIAQSKPDAPSGDYWVRAYGSSVIRVYCDMNDTRFNSTAFIPTKTGWMRVANLDMTDIAQQCPAGLYLRSNLTRLCRKKTGAGCASIFFPTYALPFSRVCGKAIGFQYATTDAFWQYYNDRSRTVDDNYIDGLSVTVGYPRTHVWSFAAAQAEGGNGADSVYSCPCARTDVNASSVIPPFVENSYFCESGNDQWSSFGVLYEDDPLWDGQGCPENSSCCQLNSPPWFCKELGREFRSDIEVRLCVDQHIGDEEVLVQKIELYVQ